MSSIIALAGRRIDTPGTNPPRFPLDSVPLVRARIAELLRVERAAAVVASAACGADLIALEEAERIGIRRRIVLPFPARIFRRTSVTDRPGTWGAGFDRVIAAANAVGDLIILKKSAAKEDEAYDATTAAILREARALARLRSSHPRKLIAAIVWEGGARRGVDLTEKFRSLATRSGFYERSIRTILG